MKVTYKDEHMVVHKLVDPGARACILHRQPRLNERRMNRTLLWYFALKEKVMMVNVCLTSREQLTIAQKPSAYIGAMSPTGIVLVVICRKSVEGLVEGRR